METIVGVVLGLVLGLVANEISDFSPWLAKRLVGWAARRWSADAEVATAYAEEWTAVVEERPGKLFKLFTALRFAGGAAGRAGARRAARTRAKWSSLPNIVRLEAARFIAVSATLFAFGGWLVSQDSGMSTLAKWMLAAGCALFLGATAWHALIRIWGALRDDNPPD